MWAAVLIIERPQRANAGGAARIRTFQSGLDALAATQDIADRLVYGVRNTDDVNKRIDNF